MRIVVTGLFTLALVAPALRDRDSFPLSTYPMYASVRSRAASFVTALGITADGRGRRLPMDVIARTDDPLIATSRMRQVIASGRAGEVCAEIAGRAPADVVEVLVVTEEHDVVESATGAADPLRRVEHARCPVSR